MANHTLAKLRRLHEQARAFLDEKGLEQADAAPAPWLRRCVHFWLLVARSFVRNRCPVRASALAFSSLLALVPMLAVVLSVTTSILKQKGEEPIRKAITKLVEHVTPYTNPEGAGDAASTEALAKATAERERAVKEINHFISRIQSGTLGVTGMVVLVFVAIMMLARIEGTFNDIWGVTRGRSWYARVVLYWAAITLGPLLLTVALGLTSGSQLKAANDLVRGMPFVGGLLFKLLPLLVLSGLFALFYQLMPNTRVRWQAALVGGLVAGTLWHLNNVFSIYFVSRITSNNAIYGSLGMVPVFMIGLYFGWLILLFGAQVAYAFQNRDAYLQGRQAESVNQRGREFVALRIMQAIAGAFQRGDKPPGVNLLAEELSVPSRLVANLLQALIQARLVVEALDRETGYAPARPLQQITVHDVLMALRAGPGNEPATRADEARERVRSEFDRVREAEREAAAGLTLQALVETTPVPGGPGERIP